MSSRRETSALRSTLKYTNKVPRKSTQSGDGEVYRTKETSDFEPLDHVALASIEGTDYFEDDTRKSAPKGNRSSISRNAKLDTLAGQVDSMTAVFAVAQKQRDEQKYLQEERHNELLLKLDSVSMHINDEIKRIEALMNTIAEKCAMNVEDMKKDIYDYVEKRNAPIADKMRTVKSDLDTLMEKTTTEKEETICSLQTLIEPLNVKITKLRNIVDNNKDVITNNVEEISTAMMKNTNELTELIAQSRDCQSVRLSQFEKAFNSAINQVIKKQSDFELTTLESVAHIKSNIDNEITERTYCQDGIAENFGSFIKKFQDTVFAPT